MSGKIVVRQLWDGAEERTITLQDVERAKLTDMQTLNYKGRTYVMYQNKEGEKPYENKGRVTWKNLTENAEYEIPFKLIKKPDETRKRVINRPRLVHDMFQLRHKFDQIGGEGYYNIYRIGGRNPPLKYILQAWIAEETGTRFYC